MSTSEATDRDWANLPNDILHTISSMLLIRDYIAFSKVCTSWRAASAPSKLPCLLYFPQPHDYSEQSKLPILCTDLSNIDNISNSGFYSPYAQGNWHCIGSQDGWLITVIVNRVAANSLMTYFTGVVNRVALVNLFTAQQIELPSFSFHLCNIVKAVIILPCQTDDVPTVVILTRCESTPIFFNKGNQWNSKSRCSHPEFVDLFCIDGKLYSMDSNGGVYAIKLNNSSYRAKTLKAGYFHFTKAENLFVKDKEGRCMNIVKFGRDILCIETFYSEFGKVVKFAIIKLDMEKNIWVSMKDLGGCSLFLGFLCSISVSAEPNNIGRKGNVIYFQYNWSRWKTIGAFDMEDGSYKTNKPSHPQPFGTQNVWFAPQF